MANARVSIVIPAYNHEAQIAETLESVLAQTYTAWEAVVVDDGSKDGTAAVAARFAPRIQCHRQRNAGVAAARNAGFELTLGEYVTFLDSDDLWAPRCLESLVREMERDPRVGMVYGQRCRLKDGWVYDCIEPVHRGRVVEKVLLKDPTLRLGVGTNLIRRSALREVGLFDSRFSTSADYDMWLRLTAAFPVAFVTETTLLYRVVPGSMHRNFDRFEQDRLGVLEKFFGEGPGRAPELARLKGAAFARAHYAIGGEALHQRKWGRASAHLMRSSRLDPGFVARRLFGVPGRWMARALGQAPLADE